MKTGSGGDDGQRDQPDHRCLLDGSRPDTA
jgi:hypothetical protein